MALSWRVLKNRVVLSLIVGPNRENRKTAGRKGFKTLEYAGALSD